MDTDTDSDTNWENNPFAKRKLRSPVLRAKNAKNESGDTNMNIKRALPQQTGGSESLLSSPDKGNSSFDSGLGYSEAFHTSENFGEIYKRKGMPKSHSSPEQKSYDSTDSENENSRIECLVLHRLPGEKLGMILGIEGEKIDREKVKAVRVRSVTIGGAAERASGGSRGVGIGDEILEINGLDLHTLTYKECVTVFKEMPLQVFMLIKRSKPNMRNLTENEGLKDIEGFLAFPPKGFTLHTVTVQKKLREPLGLSIVPSYGSTKHFYQVKRLLASGPSARNCQLCVGDRLLSYNEVSLQNLVQSECMSILKQPNEHITFRILRPTNSGQRLRISVNKSNRKDISWYSSGLDSTPETTDSETEANIPNSEGDGVELRGFHLHSSGARHQPQVNEVFSNRQFKIAYAEPERGSHVSTVPDTSIGFKRPAQKADIHHFLPHGLSKSLKMDDSVGENQHKTDGINLCSSDMDWLDSLGSTKSGEHVKVEVKSGQATSNGNAVLLDFGEDLLTLEMPSSKEPDGGSESQLPPPAAFADISNFTSDGMSNQNGFRDIWQSGVCETEFISEADNDVPVTNIDDLLEKSQQSNQHSNPSDNDSELFSLTAESSAADSLMEFDSLQSKLTTNSRVFYQPPQEISSGYNSESNFGDILGSNPESEVEQILTGKIVGANERDEDECLSTFSSHSGSTVIHRTGSAFDDMGDSAREALPENDAGVQDCNINYDTSERNVSANISVGQVTTVQVESPQQDTNSEFAISGLTECGQVNLNSVSGSEKDVGLSVTTVESPAPVKTASDNDVNSGEVVTLHIEEPIADQVVFPSDPCIVEEHIIQVEKCPQVEAVSSNFTDSSTENQEADIIPVHASRDVVVTLDGATDIPVLQNSKPDKSVLPEMVENLIDVCKADDTKFHTFEESNMGTAVEEEFIVRTDKVQTSLLESEVYPETVMSVEVDPHKESKEESVVLHTQTPPSSDLSDKDSTLATEDPIVCKQENMSLMSEPNSSDIIIPVNAPSRSTPSETSCSDPELENKKAEALPYLVDSMVLHLEQSEKNSGLKGIDQIQNREVIFEENIVPAEVSREQAEIPTEVSNDGDLSKDFQNQNEVIKDVDVFLTTTPPPQSPISAQSVSGVQYVVSVEQPHKSRKSKLENMDDIVPVKVPRRSVNTTSYTDEAENEQQRIEALPHLVDSMVQHLAENNKNDLHTREQSQNDLIVEENIVPAEVSRDSVAMTTDLLLGSEKKDSSVVSSVVEEQIVEVTKSQSSECSPKVNGEADIANGYHAAQNASDKSSLSVSMDPSYKIDLEHQEKILDIEKKPCKEVDVNILFSNGNTKEIQENIIPKKSPRRLPNVELSTKTKDDKTNGQPFVDHLVAHINSTDKLYQNNVNNTKSKDFVTEDVIVPKTKLVEENPVTVFEAKKIMASHIPTEEKTKSVSEISSEKTNKGEDLVVTVSKEITQETVTVPMSESLKTSSESFGGSLIESPKDSKLTTPHFEANLLSNRQTRTLPPALAPVPDQPKTRRLPNIKAFTAKGFTPVKLSSLGASSVIKTVSLDRNKISKLSAVNMQASTTPSMKLASFNSRSEEGPFQIDLLSGILGLGMKVTGRTDGFFQVSDIQKNSAIEKNGHIRVGDYLLAINGREITGLPDAKVQQILRLLPRGIAKLVISTCPVDKENLVNDTSTSSDREPQQYKDASQLTKEVSDNRFDASKTSKGDADIITPARTVEVFAAPQADLYVKSSPSLPSPGFRIKQESAFQVQDSVPVKGEPTVKLNDQSHEVDVICVEQDAKQKVQPPPVKPRKRVKSSEKLSLDVDLAMEAAEQQSQQETEGSLDVTAHAVMVRPSASPRTSLNSPKGPPPAVLPRTSRPRRDTSGSDTSKPTSPQLSPRTELRDEWDSNRKPSSVAKQFGTVKSPMSKKMSGLIDRFQHEELSPVSPESDKVFSPRQTFSDQTSNLSPEPRKLFSFSVSEETTSETKANISPKSPPKVAPKPKRRSGEINYRPILSEGAASDEPSPDENIMPEPKSSLYSPTPSPKIEKRAESSSGGYKLTTRPHSVETVFNTRSLVSASSLNRLKGLQIPSKSGETLEESQNQNPPTSSLHVNPSKLSPALRPRSGPAAFTRVQPKIHQVTPKLNIRPIKLHAEASDNSTIKKEDSYRTQDDSSKIKEKHISKSVHTDSPVIDVVVQKQSLSEAAPSENLRGMSLDLADSPTSNRDMKDSPDQTEIKVSHPGVKSSAPEEIVSINKESPASEILVTAVPVEVLPEEGKMVELIAPECLAEDGNITSTSAQGSVDNDNKNNNAAQCHIDVPTCSGSANDASTTDEEISKLQPDLPVLEKFAETVSCSVIDSSLIEASDLISTDQPLEKENNAEESNLETKPFEQISNSVVKSDLISSDFHEGLPPLSSEISVNVSADVEAPHERRSEDIASNITVAGIDGISPKDVLLVTNSLPETSESPVCVDVSSLNDMGHQVDSFLSPVVGDFVPQPELSSSDISIQATVSGLENMDKVDNVSAGESVDGDKQEIAPEIPISNQASEESDSDAPPSLPSSAPPPLPSSPPPDLVGNTTSPSFQIEQPLNDINKPMPPVALRRHQENSLSFGPKTSTPPSLQDVNDGHSRQEAIQVEIESTEIQESKGTVETQPSLSQEQTAVTESKAPSENSIEKEDTNKPQTCSSKKMDDNSRENPLEPPSATKDEQDITESILEINSVDNAISVCDPDSHTPAEPIELVTEKDITITLHTTKTLVPDINGSLSTDTESSVTSAPPDLSPVPAVDGNCEVKSDSTQNTTYSATMVTRRKVTVVSNKNNSDVSPDELNSMLNKANDLLETTGATDDEILVIVLYKKIGEKVGLSFKGGPNKEILVSDVDPNSAAGKDGHIQNSDQILLINGKTVDDRTPHDARVMLRTSKEQLVLVLGRSASRALAKTSEESLERRRRSTSRERRRMAPAESSQLQQQLSPEKSTPTPEPGVVRAKPVRSSLSPEKDAVSPSTGTHAERDESSMKTFEVSMNKGVTGLGFCLEGGIGSPLGDKPILIKRLFKGGAADKCGLLREKDEIVEVNGRSFQGLRHYEAWNYLKFLPDGEVKLLIRR